MRRSASEVIRELEMRVARLEKKSNADYALVVRIERQLDEEGLTLKDLERNPKLLDLDEIEHQNPGMKSNIQRWVKKGLITIEGGEYEETRGSQSYPLDWDAYLITKKGIQEIKTWGILRDMGRLHYHL
jgi:hypothetical protein